MPKATQGAKGLAVAVRTAGEPSVWKRMKEEPNPIEVARRRSGLAVHARGRSRFRSLLGESRATPTVFKPFPHSRPRILAAGPALRPRFLQCRVPQWISDRCPAALPCHASPPPSSAASSRRPSATRWSATSVRNIDRAACAMDVPRPASGSGGRSWGRSPHCCDGAGGGAGPDSSRAPAAYAQEELAWKAGSWTSAMPHAGCAPA